MARRQRALVVALAMLLGLSAGAAPAWAQWPAWRLSDSGVDSTFSTPIDPLDARVDGGPPLGALGQRLDLGLFGLGLSVAARRPSLSLVRPGDTGPAAASTSLYRLGETDLSTTDISVDLRLRWPSGTTSAEPATTSLQPYLSLGPALSVPVGEEPLILGRTTRHDAAMSLGLRGAVGLTWHVAPDASLFGEYRLIQDRPLRSRTSGDVGVDLLYGFSLRF